MSLTTDGTDDYATASAGVVSAAAGLWMLAWVKLAVLGQGARMAAELSNGVDTTENFRLTTDATDHVSAQSGTAGANSISSVAAAVGDTNWHLWLANFGSNSNRVGGYDGTLATAQTTTRATSGITTLRLMLNMANNQDLPVGSKVAHFVLGTGVLSQPDFTLLAAGTNPLAISAPGIASIVDYWPLTSAVTNSISGGRVLSLGGNASFDANDNPAVNAAPSAASGRHFRPRLGGRVLVMH